MVMFEWSDEQEEGREELLDRMRKAALEAAADEYVELSPDGTIRVVKEEEQEEE